MNKLIDILAERRLFKVLTKKIKNFFPFLLKGVNNVLSLIAIEIIRSTTEVKNNEIVFVTSRGDYYCNCRAIADEILDQGLNYKLTWVIRKGTNTTIFPNKMKLVKRDSANFYRAISSAKIIIDNSVNTSYMKYRKKSNQIFIETWHGSIGIKKANIESINDKKWIRKAKETAFLTDYCISNSDFEDSVYKEDFWKTNTILKYGHPRNDILFSIHQQKQEKRKKLVCDYFQIPEDSKICLYAPTYRDTNNLSVYLLDYNSLIEALTLKFGGEWVIMTRMHFMTLKKMKKIKMPENVINANKFHDIQDLMLVADVGITDFSSWICDFMLNKKPGFLYATDQDEYKDERGFYYPLSSLPFPVTDSIESLTDSIINFDNKKFQADCENFLRDKGCIDDGRASERVVGKIKEIIESRTYDSI
ncbi:MAG: CDP-glycerol glycerophosphotransferase family protein [Eubacteriales bacterium]